MQSPDVELPAPQAGNSLLSWLGRHRTAAMLSLAAILFLVHSLFFLFVQDDAFITFRYVQNFLQGKGLVYNSGERVEGYTTFLWTMLLALPAAFGGDLVLFSHLFGIAAGIGTILVLYGLSHSLAATTTRATFPFIAVTLTLTNPSVAYWTASGMETPLFTLLLLGGVLVYLRECRGERIFLATPLLFLLLSLARPEGILLFGLTIAHAAATALRASGAARRSALTRLLLLGLFYALPLAAFTGWRLSYYGKLFPNTFYAKAGLTLEGLSAGLEYAHEFAATYLLYGTLFLVPLVLVLWKGRTRERVYIATLASGFSLAVVLIGGDVLHGHRFFVPVLPLIYLLVQEGLAIPLQSLPRSRFLAVAVTAVIAGSGFFLALPSLRSSHAQETALVDRMGRAGQWLTTLPSPPTVAATTIGALGYYSEAPLIDMLGLTDTMIARHPEFVDGLSSSWKERHYNTSYLLGREPEWIFFSTDIKPSAFAERALFTRTVFRRQYYPCYIHLDRSFDDVKVAYRRAPRSLVTADGCDSTVRGVEFIEAFNRGLNARRSPSEALAFFLSARETAPEDFALLHEQIGNTYHSLGDTVSAAQSYRRATALNPAMISSHIMLALYARQENNLGEARTHLQAALDYNPEYSLPWTLLGENRALAGDTAAAVRLLTEALRLAPDNVEALRYLSHLQRRFDLRQPD